MLNLTVKTPVSRRGDDELEARDSSAHSNDTSGHVSDLALDALHSGLDSRLQARRVVGEREDVRLRRTSSEDIAPAAE